VNVRNFVCGKTPGKAMTKEISTISHLSGAMTTQEIDQTHTGRNSMPSSSATGDEFYWAWAVLFMGVVGTSGNALILYALVASKQHKKHALIVNQNALDLFSSFFLIVGIVAKLCNGYLTGVFGYFMCFTILSDNVAYWGANGSMINLAIITIDRYLKVVHPTWSRKYLRPWVVFSAMAFAWLAAILFNNIITFLTAEVVDGVCYSYVFDSHMSNLAPVIFYCLFFYLLIIIIFIFCYWRILVAIRRQARVMASHNASGSNTAQTQSQQIQTTVIKTMVFVSAFFSIAWLPMTAYALLTATQLVPALSSGSFYNMASFIAFFYTNTNPFIYATKFDPVKAILKEMIPCKKTPVQLTDGSPYSIGNRTVDRLTVEARN